MKRIKTLGGIVVILVLTGCATLDKVATVPDWVHGLSARYPTPHYLIGRGAAPSLDDAKDRARADLAKTFEVTIAAESSDLQTFERVTQGAGEAETKAQLQISRNVQTRTERVMRGIEIADLWQDPNSGNYFALAVLRRLQAAQTLRDDVQRLDQATRLFIDQARTEVDMLRRIATASRAVEAQVERATVQRALQIVDITGHGLPPLWSLQQLRHDREALIQSLSLLTQTHGPYSVELRPIVEGAVAAAGFQSGAAGAAHFALEVALDLSDLGQRDGWYWLKGNLEVVLKDAGHKVRGVQHWVIKSAALSRDEALRRALDQTSNMLKQDLRTTLIGFAAGDGGPP